MKLLWLYLAALVAIVHGGANDPIADNELGLTAKECSKFCSAKDGLQLWLSFGELCMEARTISPTTGISLSTESAKESSSKQQVWSPATVGSVSAVMGGMCMLVGLMSGAKYRERQSRLFPVM